MKNIIVGALLLMVSLGSAAEPNGGSSFQDFLKRVRGTMAKVGSYETKRAELRKIVVEQISEELRVNPFETSNKQWAVWIRILRAVDDEEGAEILTNLLLMVGITPEIQP